ncbi:MAG: phage protein GemA/Gp16 family protein [Syntrophobacteraceae bacterium]|nr:regulatory protein GemA [Desulfobacteraceae bacterium]
MARAEAKINSRQVQAIQAKRHALGVSDEVYSEMKRSVGVESTRDLNIIQFNDLMRRMDGTARRKAKRATADGRRKTEGGKSAGGNDPSAVDRPPSSAWKPLHHSARRSGMHNKPAADKEAMIRKIEAILTELKLDWAYADGIAKQQTRGQIERLRFCDLDQTRKVLQALCVHQNRQRKKNMAEGVDVRDQKFYLRELQSDQCQCGKSKGSGKSFCYSCWKKLPVDLQRPLYRRLGQGYEEAYEQAARHLDDKGHQYE